MVDSNVLCKDKKIKILCFISSKLQHISKRDFHIMIIDGLKNKFYFTEIFMWLKYGFLNFHYPKNKTRNFFFNIITLINMPSTFDSSTFSKFWKPL